MSRVNETLKNMVDELDPDRRLDELVARAESVLGSTLARLGDFTHDHRGDIDRAVERTLDRVEDSLDDRVQGRTGDRLVEGVVYLRERFGDGLDWLDRRRPPADGD